MEYKGEGMYGVTYEDMDEYIAEIDVCDEDDFYDTLDDMRAAFGDDVVLIKMEA